MTWREDLRRVKMADGRNLVGASFRGVTFFVESSQRGGGRRTVVHEFPLRDDPFVEDLGRRARTFPIDGYVLGDNYMAQRDALLSALEDESGPGELVHPYYGVRRAICTNVQVKESRDEGGIAKFEIELAETPNQAPVPTDAVDSAGQVSASADAASSASRAELVAAVDPSLPSFANASSESALTKMVAGVTDKMDQAYSAAGEAVDIANQATTQELANLTAQLTVITAEAASIISDPGFVFDQFSTALDGLTNAAAAAPEKLMGAYLDSYATDTGTPVVATTVTRTAELANQTAVAAALRRVLLFAAAKLAPSVPFATLDDAIDARDRIVALLDEQAALATDTAYPAIVDLRSQVMQAIPGGSTFPRLVTVTRPVAIPSIVLAYQLYGSTALELDLVARNDAPHPGFMFGDLKALTDG